MNNAGATLEDAILAFTLGETEDALLILSNMDHNFYITLRGFFFYEKF